MGNTVDPLIAWIRMLLAYFLALLSFSYPESVDGSGPTSGWPLKDHPDFRSLAYKIDELNVLTAQLIQEAVKTPLLENHPFIQALVAKMDTLELKTNQRAEEANIKDLEMKSSRQIEEIQGLSITVAELENKLAETQERLNSSEKAILETIGNNTDALRGELRKTEQLFSDAVTTQERERLREVQGLNNEIVEQGKDLTQVKEKLKSLEKDVVTQDLGDSPIVVNLSDYKGGRLMVKTTYDRILAFQPVHSNSLDAALKFIKIVNAKDGTRVALYGNETLNPDVRHSDLAYKTIYTKGNRAVIEFDDDIPDGISIKISKAVDCPFNLGDESQCARVVDAESCYCNVFTKRSWQEQNTFCQTNGFSLLTLESAEEEKAVTAVWGSLRFWMSLTDRTKEGIWVWDASGVALANSDYANWKKGQPDSNGGNEDCVEWRPWTSEWPSRSGWNDNSCLVHIGAICERHPSSSSKVPSSCADLRKAGQSISGLYQVQTNTDVDGKKITTVFCDMSEDIGAEGFETVVGVNDVKSIIVHFSVARKSDYEGNGTVIPYEIITLNNGNAMNITSGVFTAPVAGIYSFTFNFVNNAGKAWAFIRHKGDWIRGSGGENGRNSVSTHVKLVLNTGDEVDTYLYAGPLYSYDLENAINFSGSLLVEL